ncbi:armadillo-type protein [Mycena latifolia]|nr:armadillo-type protein [Mycena latifolia]
MTATLGYAGMKAVGDHEASTLCPLLSSPPMHHSLTRQPTRDTLRSWWSDRNPLGPNIDLHAAAKPLMRFMYRRDVLALIARTRGTPLSSEDMEIYSSYLAYKYVSSSSKATILMELGARIESEDDANVVADSFVLHFSEEFLSSSDTTICRSMCHLLAGLARRETTVPVVLSHNPCPLLVARLGKHNAVLQSVTEALYWIAQWVDGAQAALDANILEFAGGLLGNDHTRDWMGKTLQTLIDQPLTAPVVIDQLLLLLQGDDPEVVDGATQALSWIATSPDVAQAIMDANVLERVPELVELQHTGVREHTWELLEQLARQEITAKTGVKQLISLFRSGSPSVSEAAARTLSRTLRSPQGAQILMAEDVLEFLPELFEFPVNEARRSRVGIYDLMGGYKIPLKAAVRYMLALLRSVNPTSAENAAWGLYGVVSFPEGAQAVLEADLLESVPELLESPNPTVRTWTWAMLKMLSHHAATARSAVAQVVFLLQGGNPVVTQRAGEILNEIAKSPLGAHAAVHANALGCVGELLASPDPGVQVEACALLTQLATHKSTRVAVLRANPCVQLVSLSRGKTPMVARRAIWALCMIASCAEGARAVVDAEILECVGPVLESPGTNDILHTCRILGELARHKTTLKALLAVRPCSQLVCLLQRTVATFDSPLYHLAVRASAAFALAQISESPQGAAAVAATDFLVHLEALLDSPDHQFQVWICVILRNLARLQPERLTVFPPSRGRA